MNDMTIQKQNKSFEITSFEQAEKFATMFANSDFAPKDFRGKPANVLIAMHLGNELGLQPLQALQNISVINGRSTIWGDLALALVRSVPECKGVKEWIEGSVKDNTAVAHCEVRRNDEVIKESFSVEQAKRAALWGRQGPWTQYPERMLTMRARGFALRNAFPDVLKGVYIREEMEGSDLKFQHSANPSLSTESIQGQVIEHEQQDDITHLVSAINDSKNENELRAVADIIKASNVNTSAKSALSSSYREKLNQLRSAPKVEEAECAESKEFFEGTEELV